MVRIATSYTAVVNGSLFSSFLPGSHICVHDPSLVDMTLQAVFYLLCTVAGLAPSRPHSPNLVSDWSPIVSFLKSSDKDPSVPSNCRGITLASVISQFF